jgi:hypothetical protein
MPKKQDPRRHEIEFSVLESWEDCYCSTLECLSLSKCVFAVDFGKWKKGYEAQNIVFNFEKSTIEEYSEDGQLVHSERIGLVCLQN